MLPNHFEKVEKSILAHSDVQSTTGHNLHKGTPREIFIREFLSGHLSERVAIGTGEIIDADSKSGEPRNQIDIVVYKRDYPKLDFGGGINGFLAESVIATIEVKSVLNQAALDQSALVASKLKKLKRSTMMGTISIGQPPPSILSYVVAYDGPSTMQTAYRWLENSHSGLGIEMPMLPPQHQQRFSIASPSIDAIFVLGRGFIHFDNTAINYINDIMREAYSFQWLMSDVGYGSLLMLFLLINQSVVSFSSACLNPDPYIQSFKPTKVCIGPIPKIS
ncbi:hypothetical protein M2447_002020 [Ereboglobus sp. PH5-10]|uniref:DUF6602 domain-containing protein n=1 Tax=Ereboglobus sp. PH5-10 TaxID=2940629 RepID=UPI00240704F6|nr:DUF6602 domain-containing protein [Ereboglobus sp. PH5-10]MDF9827915.1 hypothetical protein [Ereboglobus sp. PH5-10]